MASAGVRIASAMRSTASADHAEVDVRRAPVRHHRANAPPAGTADFDTPADQLSHESQPRAKGRIVVPRSVAHAAEPGDEARVGTHVPARSPAQIRKAGRRRVVTLLRPKAPRMAERLVEENSLPPHRLPPPSSMTGSEPADAPRPVGGTCRTTFANRRTTNT